MIEERILAQLKESIGTEDTWHELANLLNDDSRGVHLAIMVEPFLSYILDGKKTVESRFSKNLIAPYMRIEPGDLVILKRTAGPVVASFVASTVEFVDLNKSEYERLQREYSDAICADEEFWNARRDKRFATLVGVGRIREHRALAVDKSDRRGWLVLRDPAATRQMSLL